MTIRILWALSLSTLLLVGGLQASAEEGDTARDLQQLKRKIADLQAAAERAQETGRDDEAHELAKRARDLTRKVEAYYARRARAAKAEHAEAKPKVRVKRVKRRREQDPEPIIRGLTHGIKALKALGGQEALIAQLSEMIEGIKHRAKAHASPEAAKHESHEHRALRARLETLRLALPALRKGEKRDGVEIVERAIHSGELLLAGRHDEDARRVYERTPPLEQLADVLHMASDLWREFGNADRAEAISRLRAYYAKRARMGPEERRAADTQARARAERDADDRKRRAQEAHGRELENARAHERRRDAERETRRRRDEDMPRAEEIRDLQKQVKSLRAQFAELRRHLGKLHEERKAREK